MIFSLIAEIFLDSIFSSFIEKSTHSMIYLGKANSNFERIL